jgi:hypothetical protein
MSGVGRVRRRRPAITPLSRWDEGDDRRFYADHASEPLEPATASALRAAITATLPAQLGRVLDLMSGSFSYLPDAPQAQVVGLGLNAQELARNPVLTAGIVHDVNASPRLPFPDASFDAVVCTSGVQYMIQPVTLFAEVHRVLRSRCPFIVAYTDNFYPSKLLASGPAGATGSAGRVLLP